MATITFTVESAVDTIVNVSTAPQRAKLAQMAGARRSIQFPFGPQGISYDGLGLEYSTVDRPGLAPLLEPTSKKLRKIDVTAVIATASDGGRSSVESQLATFAAIANDNVDCAFTYGAVTLPYRVRLTDFSYTAIQRDLDGNITQAEVTLNLQEHIIFSQSIVALKAIEYPPDPVPDGSTKTPSSSTSSSKPAPAPAPPAKQDIPTEVRHPGHQP